MKKFLSVYLGLSLLLLFVTSAYPQDNLPGVKPGKPYRLNPAMPKQNQLVPVNIRNGDVVSMRKNIFGGVMTMRIEELSKILNTGTYQDAKKAIDELVMLNHPLAMDELGELLEYRNYDDSVREAVVEAFVKLGKSNLPALVDILQYGNSALDVCAIEAVVKFESAAVPLLTAILQNRHQYEYIRANAAYVLGRIGEAAAPAVPALMEEFKYEGNGWKLHGETAVALGKIGKAAAPAVHLLVKDLKSGDHRRQWYAAVALGDMGPAAEQAAPLLIDAWLHCKNGFWSFPPSVSEEALEKLGPFAASALIEAQKHAVNLPEIRDFAAALFWRIDEGALAEYLEQKYEIQHDIAVAVVHGVRYYADDYAKTHFWEKDSLGELARKIAEFILQKREELGERPIAGEGIRVLLVEHEENQDGDKIKNFFEMLGSPVKRIRITESDKSSFGSNLDDSKLRQSWPTTKYVKTLISISKNRIPTTIFEDGHGSAARFSFSTTNDTDTLGRSPYRMYVWDYARALVKGQLGRNELEFDHITLIKSACHQYNLAEKLLQEELINEAAKYGKPIRSFPLIVTAAGKNSQTFWCDPSAVRKFNLYSRNKLVAALARILQDKNGTLSKRTIRLDDLFRADAMFNAPPRYVMKKQDMAVFVPVDGRELRAKLGLDKKANVHQFLEIGKAEKKNKPISYLVEK